MAKSISEVVNLTVKFNNGKKTIGRFKNFFCVILRKLRRTKNVPIAAHSSIIHVCIVIFTFNAFLNYSKFQ